MEEGVNNPGIKLALVFEIEHAPLITQAAKVITGVEHYEN